MADAMGEDTAEQTQEEDEDQEQFLYLRSDPNIEKPTVIFQITSQTADMIEILKCISQLTINQSDFSAEVASTSVMKAQHCSPDILERVIRWCQYHENDDPFEPSKGEDINNSQNNENLRLDDSDDNDDDYDTEDDSDNKATEEAGEAEEGASANPNSTDKPKTEDDTVQLDKASTSEEKKDATSEGNDIEAGDPDAKARKMDVASDSPDTIRKPEGTDAGGTGSVENEEEEERMIPRSEIRTVVIDEERYWHNAKLFEDDFFDMDNKTLFQVLQAANYLIIPALIEAGARQVAKKIRGKTTKGMIRVMQIREDS